MAIIAVKLSCESVIRLNGFTECILSGRYPIRFMTLHVSDRVVSDIWSEWSMSSHYTIRFYSLSPHPFCVGTEL